MSVLEECTEAILLQKIGKKLSSFMLININILWLKNNQIVMDLRGVDSESNYWQEKHLNINCVKLAFLSLASTFQNPLDHEEITPFHSYLEVHFSVN